MDEERFIKYLKRDRKFKDVVDDLVKRMREFQVFLQEKKGNDPLNEALIDQVSHQSETGWELTQGITRKSTKTANKDSSS